MEEEEDEIVVVGKPEEPPTQRRKSVRLIFPRRVPSEVIPPRKIIYVTADKTTCVKCRCFPKEDPYEKPKKLNPCQKSPLTLYELSAAVVDQLRFPDAFRWSEWKVARWMMHDVGLKRYKMCILDNHINGRRLLLCEDPSHLAMINIHDLEHIKLITSKIRELYSTEFIQFTRSIGLPPRKPLTHCTFFKSRTGPSWGIRQNWTRSDILRWMKIIEPEPIYRDHWELVWYQKPDYPKLLFGKIPPRTTREHIPHYKPTKDEPCKEYLAPRKFRLQKDIPDEKQEIWMEHPEEPKKEESGKKGVEKKKYKPTVPRKSRLDPRRISLTGLAGKDLILARRLMPKQKFLAIKY